MTHEQVVAALRQDLEPCHDYYPTRRPRPKPTRPPIERRMWETPYPSTKPDPTGFAPGCVI